MVVHVQFSNAGTNYANRWPGGQSSTGQTFQVSLHLAPTATGEASKVTAGDNLTHRLMWL